MPTNRKRDRRGKQRGLVGPQLNPPRGALSLAIAPFASNKDLFGYFQCIWIEVN
jgi:hypothetical protein